MSPDKIKIGNFINEPRPSLYFSLNCSNYKFKTIITLFKKKKNYYNLKSHSNLLILKGARSSEGVFSSASSDKTFPTIGANLNPLPEINNRLKNVTSWYQRVAASKYLKIQFL